MSLITVIGRGHSGTRAMSHTLTASGVYMGFQLNKSGDLIPAEDLYEACNIMAHHVRHSSGVSWDFDRLHTMPIDPAFTRLVKSYLESVLSSDQEHRGWKLPETTLILPWIVRLFPDARYIYWVRDPRDSIIGRHRTDDLADFGVPYATTGDIREMRAISWKYQREIIKATPRPIHTIDVRFEDFVLHQQQTLIRLGDFLDIPLTSIPVRPESIGRWRTDSERHDFALFHDDLVELGYAQR